jgi:hypothetical protein
MKWRLRDPGDGSTWTFERNPKQMSTPHLPQQTTQMAVARDGLTRTYRQHAVASDFSFGGDIRTQSQYDQLQLWVAKGRRIEVRDHLNRTWDVLPLQLDVEEQRPSQTVAWKYTYTVKALVYGQVS